MTSELIDDETGDELNRLRRSFSRGNDFSCELEIKKSDETLMTKTTARTIGGMDDKEVWKETRDKSMINEVTAYIFDTTSDKSTFQSLLAAIVLSFSDVSIAKMSSPICEKKGARNSNRNETNAEMKDPFSVRKKSTSGDFLFCLFQGKKQNWGRAGAKRRWRWR